MKTQYYGNVHYFPFQFVMCSFARIVACLLKKSNTNILGFQRSVYPTHAWVDETVISDVRFQAFTVTEFGKILGYEPCLLVKNYQPTDY